MKDDLIYAISITGVITQKCSVIKVLRKVTSTREKPSDLIALIVCCIYKTTGTCCKPVIDYTNFVPDVMNSQQYIIMVEKRSP